MVMTPLVKLAMKPTKEGVKMVRKVCRFVVFAERLEDSGSGGLDLTNARKSSYMYQIQHSRTK
jgi:hypothetical protein